MNVRNIEQSSNVTNIEQSSYSSINYKIQETILCTYIVGQSSNSYKIKSSKVVDLVGNGSGINGATLSSLV